MQCPDGAKLQIFSLAPAEELGDGLDIGRACVFVADGRREEFEEMFAGLITGRRDDRRHRKFRWPDGSDDLRSRLAHKLQSVIVEPAPP